MQSEHLHGFKVHQQKAAYGKFWLKTYGKLHQKQRLFSLAFCGCWFAPLQLFGEIAGKIHFLFCLVLSKPCGLTISALLWSLPRSASWEPSLAWIACCLLIITQQKFSYVLFIAFFWSRWHHLHLTLKTSPESAFTDLCQIWVSPDEKHNYYSKPIFLLFSFLELIVLITYHFVSY